MDDGVGGVGKRLFLAVDIDRATREAIARISDGLRGTIERHARASWVHPDRMHLTLQFLGTVDAPLEGRMRDALARPISEAAFTVSFDRLGLFPERGSPRVLWLGVGEGAAALRRLREALLEGDSRRAAPSRPDEPFSPHLTLARFRHRSARAKIAEIIDIPASAGPSRIDRVTLYESRLSRAGPTYVPLAEALLTCPPTRSSL